MIDIEPITAQLRVVHELGNVKRRRGGWGVPPVTKLEDTVLGAAIEALESQRDQLKCVMAVIEYATEHCGHGEASTFLKAWSSGDFDMLRVEWDQVPPDVFIAEAK